MKIRWDPPIERHVLGKCDRGKIYIRLNREDKVTGIYTLFGKTEKHLPLDESEEKLENAKIAAEIILENFDFAEKLAKINN